MSASADEICALCQQLLGTDDLQAMLCTCVFHKECLNDFVDQCNAGNLLDAKCPKCRSTNFNILDQSLSLLGNSPPQGNDAEQIHPIPGSWEEIADSAIDLEGAGAGEVAAGQEDPVEDVAAEGASTGAEDNADDELPASPSTWSTIEKQYADEAESVAQVPTEIPTPPQAPRLCRARKDSPQVDYKSTALSKLDHVFDNVYCGTCGDYGLRSKARLISKMKGTFRCGTCASKCVQLSSELGEWPTPEFRALSDEDQKTFMKAMGGATKATDVLALAKRHFQRFQKQAKYFDDSGEYLPLSVWGNRGFDVAAIEKNSETRDIKNHPVLGRVYRVQILTTGSRGEKGSASQFQMSNAGTPNTDGSSGGRATEHGDEKRRKISQKQEEAQQKKEDKKKELLLAKWAKQGDKILNTFIGVKEALQALLSSPEAGHLPHILLLAARMHWEKLTVLEAKVEAAKTNDQLQYPEMSAIKPIKRDADATLKVLRTQLDLIKNMNGRNESDGEDDPEPAGGAGDPTDH